MPPRALGERRYNLVAIPGGVWRFTRKARVVWRLNAVIVVGAVPSVPGPFHSSIIDFLNRMICRRSFLLGRPSVRMAWCRSAARRSAKTLRAAWLDSLSS